MYLIQYTSRKLLFLVPEAGIEPAWSFWNRGILSPLRLPISPLRQQKPQWPDSSIGVQVGQGQCCGANRSVLCRLRRKSDRRASRFN